MYKTIFITVLLFFSLSTKKSLACQGEIIHSISELNEKLNNHSGTESCNLIIDSKIEINSSNYNNLPIIVKSNVTISGLAEAEIINNAHYNYRSKICSNENFDNENQVCFNNFEVEVSRNIFRKQNINSYPPIFLVLGDNVVIEGLTFTGPQVFPEDLEIDKAEVSSAILATSWSENFIIQNNNFRGWWHAVVLSGAQNVNIRENIFANNNTQGYQKLIGKQGYGIGLYGIGSSALIESNIFSSNRHSVSADGSPMQRYTARYNIITGKLYDATFDVHSSDPKNSDGDPLKYNDYCDLQITIDDTETHQDLCQNRSIDNEVKLAGQQFIIERNIWHNTEEHITDVENNKAGHGRMFQIRGKSTRGTYFRYNFFNSPPKFYEDKNANKFKSPQIAYVKHDENWTQFNNSTLHVYDNYFKPTFDSLTDLKKIDLDGNGEKNELLATTGHAWFVGQYAANPSIQATLPDMLATSLISNYSERINHLNNTFQNSLEGMKKIPNISHAATDLQSKVFWKFLTKSNYRAVDIGIGDFNGDGKDDVFVYGAIRSGEWYYSASATGAWSKLGTSYYRPNQLAIADFTGDGISDLVAYGALRSGELAISRSSNTSWEAYGNFFGRINSLVAGNFDSDRAKELLKFESGNFYYLDGSIEHTYWTRINNNSASNVININKIFIGNFNTELTLRNNDQNISDILVNDIDNGWFISIDSTSEFNRFNGPILENGTNYKFLKFDQNNFSNAIKLQNKKLYISNGNFSEWLEI